MSFERVDNVHSSDGFALRVLGLIHSIANPILKEDIEHTASLLVDETRDALHTTTKSDGRLRFKFDAHQM